MNQTEGDTLEDVRKLVGEHVLYGGRWHPIDCIARYHVAIIIPFRDRETHLMIFLKHMHPILQRQQINYGIYVIEQVSRIFLNNICFY